MVLPNDPSQPEDEAVPEKGGSRLTIWLVILGLCLLFLPLYLIGQTIQESTTTQQSELDSIQATLSYTPPPDPSAEALTGTLVQIQRENGMLESLQSTLVAIHIDWPSVMAVIGSYDPTQMSLTAVTQTATGISITGQADSQSIIASYSDMLRQSGLFAQVSIGSITIQAVPTATPTQVPTAVPGSEVTPEAAVTQVAQSTAVFQITATIKLQTG
jgi:Tfp pilus assembly protein PilN